MKPLNQFHKWVPGLLLAIAIISILVLGYAFTKIPSSPAQETTEHHTVAGGALAFERPSDFGLAVNADQLLVTSYIPPCMQGFDYCLYYIDSRFDSTNFESAGLRMNKRTDLNTKSNCLETLPPGYTDFTPQITHKEYYSLSVFSPLQNAATGHISMGSLYRLAFGSTCYEFETRLGMSRFENFEAGTIEKFTQTDLQFMENKLSELLEAVRLTERPFEIIFPSPSF